MCGFLDEGCCSLFLSNLYYKEMIFVDYPMVMLLFVELKILCEARCSAYGIGCAVEWCCFGCCRTQRCYPTRRFEVRGREDNNLCRMMGW